MVGLSFAKEIFCCKWTRPDCANAALRNAQISHKHAISPAPINGKCSWKGRTQFFFLFPPHTQSGQTSESETFLIWRHAITRQAEKNITGSKPLAHLPRSIALLRQKTHAQKAEEARIERERERPTFPNKQSSFSVDGNSRGLCSIKEKSILKPIHFSIGFLLRRIRETRSSSAILFFLLSGAGPKGVPSKGQGG